MGNTVNTKSSSSMEIYPGVDVISFGAQRIRETAKKLSRAAKAYVPNVQEVGKSLLVKVQDSKSGETIVRYDAGTKKPFKSSKGEKSVVKFANVLTRLKELFNRKYSKADMSR